MKKINFSNISLPAFLLSLSALLVLLLWSVFKAYIIFQYSNVSYWIGIGIYFGIRFLLIALCIVGIFFTFKKNEKTIRGPHLKEQASTLLDPLLALRAVAFLMVFMGHWFMVTFQPENLKEMVENGEIIWLLTSSPWGGVWIFFTLSGYLMAKGFKGGRYSLDRDSITNFYRNRSLRIFPLYYIAIILVGALVTPEIFAINNPINFNNLVSLLTFDSFGTMPIGALWSISTEVQFYLITPFLIILLNLFLTNKIRIFLFVLMLVLASVAYKFFILHAIGLDAWQQYVYKPLLPNLDVFLVGMTAVFLPKRWFFWCVGVKPRFVLAILSALLLWACLSFCSANTMLGEGGFKTVIFLSFAPIATSLATTFLILIVDNINFITAFNNIRPIFRLFWVKINSIGILTFSLYVWHEPLLLSFRKIAPQNLSLGISLAYLFLVFSILLYIAQFFYRNLELPYDQRRRF